MTSNDISEEPLLLPEPDGLLYRESGSWAAEKLDFVGRYIDIFETSMREKWSKRAYIDLFAGPGKIQDRNSGVVSLGSPLVALTTRYPFTNYFFVDKSQASVDALQERVDGSPLADKVRIIRGDANSVVDGIAQEVADQGSLNLAFLDPEGLELDWQTVAQLATVPRMDLIIHYPQMGLTRSMPGAFESSSETRVDSYFGGEDWRGIYEDHRRLEESFLHRRLMDYYKSNLEAVGYEDILRDDEIGIEPLLSNEEGAPLYRLIFASKHPLGRDFWKKITATDVRGQRRFW